MTSQVAVFNLECVAVASDSVRTAVNGSAERTMPSAEKILDLGDGHRVVVMGSGSAAFMGIPLSVLLGEWIAGLTAPQASLALYAADFIAWLGQRTDLFDARVQDAHFGWQLRGYYGMVRGQVLDALHDADLTDAAWDDLSVQAIVDRTVGEAVDALSARGDLPVANARSDANYIDAHRELIEYALLDTTEDMPLTVASRWRLLHELPALVLGKDEPWSRDAVLAFIGYGTDDLFPGHQVITVHGMVNDQVRYDWWEPAAVTPGRPALVTPFGQDEAIGTFLRAYNAEFLALAHRRIDHLLEKVDLSGVLLEEDGGAEEVARVTHEGLDEDFERLSRRGFIDPMLDTVETLPPADLARMAEALVGVQALRAASTRRQPSVGGPIDVVVITRRHGVQWVRRKEVALA